MAVPSFKDEAYRCAPDAGKIAMTEHAFSHPFRIEMLSARKPTRFDIAPDAGTRARIATALELSGVEALRLKGELRPAGRRDWVLDARLEATVTQACVVTLAPVTTRIEESVTRRYVVDLPESGADEIEMADDTLEPLSDVIDPGVVLVEALTLALPPFPRAEGARFEGAVVSAPGAEPLSDEEVRRPFAGLADLLARPSKED